MHYLKDIVTPPRVIFLILFIVMGLFPRFDDPDFYWHLKTGELIATSAQFPWHDVFTYSNFGNSWTQSEWLSQWLFYWVFRWGGLSGVWLFTTSIYVSCWVISYQTCLDMVKDQAKAILMVLVCCLFMGLLAPRPHIFTFLLFAGLLRVLFRFKYSRVDHDLWWIPPIMLLWANLHGGFFLGLVLLVTFSVAEWSKYCWRDAADRIAVSRLGRLSVVVLLGLLATAINPQGFRYWLYPYNAIVASGDMQWINEWQSPNFHQWPFQYYLVVVFGFFLSLTYSAKKPDLAEVAVPLVFVAGAFVSVRNLPLAALVMAPHLSAFYRDLAFSDAMRRLQWPIPLKGGGEHSLAAGFSRVWTAGNKQVGGAEGVMNLLILLLAVLAIAFIYPSRKSDAEEAVASLLPVKAVDFIQANHIEGRMFNTYHYGGYLIYRLYPKQKVFIYGRTDFYSKGFMSNYYKVYFGDKDWKRYFVGYGIDYVVCDSSAPIRQLLLADGSFKSVFEDGKHSVLLRDVEKYKGLIKMYSR